MLKILTSVCLLMGASCKQTSMSGKTPDPESSTNHVVKHDRVPWSSCKDGKFDSGDTAYMIFATTMVMM